MTARGSVIGYGATMKDGDPIVGGCLCGSVRFEGRVPSLFCAHCHCQWCRRAHGAAFVTWVGFRDAAFRITKGTDLVRWYASSNESERGFCTTCGTTMFYRSKVAAGEIHVTLASVDGEVDRAPKAHLFWADHVSWFTVGDDLPKVDRDHPALQKFQVIPNRPTS
jgi:hypothetical protein